MHKTLCWIQKCDMVPVLNKLGSTPQNGVDQSCQEEIREGGFESLDATFLSSYLVNKGARPVNLGGLLARVRENKKCKVGCHFCVYQ